MPFCIEAEFVVKTNRKGYTIGIDYETSKMQQLDQYFHLLFCWVLIMEGIY